jgi:hypothetical protein
MKARIHATIAALAVTLGAGTYVAAQGLGTVDVSNVNVEIAKDINVDVSQIPVTVQAPIGIAATELRDPRPASLPHAVRSSRS